MRPRPVCIVMPKPSYHARDAQPGNRGDRLIDHHRRRHTFTCGRRRKPDRDRADPPNLDKYTATTTTPRPPATAARVKPARQEVNHHRRDPRRGHAGQPSPTAVRPRQVASDDTVRTGWARYGTVGTGRCGPVANDD